CYGGAAFRTSTELRSALPLPVHELGRRRCFSWQPEPSNGSTTRRGSASSPRATAARTSSSTSARSRAMASRRSPRGRTSSSRSSRGRRARRRRTSASGRPRRDRPGEGRADEARPRIYRKEDVIPAKEEKIEFEGEVVEAFRNGMYRIALDNGHEALG